ncbi:MAG: glycerol-3-phosphate acyltransferase [Acidimicrobiia bacterium]|jgi:acyl phosphate:glycerol-3-phosphate acyltransferase
MHRRAAGRIPPAGVGRIVAGAALGYLAGSVSFTRLLGRRLTGSPVLDGAAIPDGDARVVLSRVSPTSLGIRAGRGWGATAALLEIGKSIIPTWWCRRIWPGSGSAEAAMVGAVLGHAYPVFHRLRGGYGQSPIVGGMLVLDPWAVPAAAAAASVAGVVLVDAWVVQDGWPPALIPWALWRGDHRMLAAVIAANAVYLTAVWPDALEHVRQRRPASEPWARRLRELPGAFSSGMDRVERA